MTPTCMCFFALLFPVLTQEVESIILADKTVQMTLHTYQVTWNEAREICEAENGMLVVDNSLERTYALMNFVDQQWPSANFWIGLHYVSSIIGGGSEWIWPDCYIQNTTIYSNWDFMQPQMSCAYYEITERQWMTDSCSEELGFVCEKNIGSCVFHEWTGYPDISLYYHYQTLPAADPSECQSLCLNTILNDRNCWAVNYDGAQCILYHSSDPYLYYNIGFSVDPVQFFLKDCYTALTDSNDNTDYEVTSNGAVPAITCMTFNDRTVSASTTSSTMTPTSSALPTTNSSLLTTSSASTTTSTVSSTTTPVLSTTSTLSPTTSPALPTTSTSSSTTSTGTLTTSHSLPTTSTDSPTTNASLTMSSSSSTSTLSSSIPTSVPTIVSTLSSDNSTSTCYRMCTCSSSTSSNATLEEKIEQIVSKLRVDKGKLSSSVRRKTSAKDERTSAKSVGYVAMVVAVLEISAILIPDVMTMARFVYNKVVTELIYHKKVDGLSK